MAYAGAVELSGFQRYLLHATLATFNGLMADRLGAAGNFSRGIARVSCQPFRASPVLKLVKRRHENCVYMSARPWFPQPTFQNWFEICILKNGFGWHNYWPLWGLGFVLHWLLLLDVLFHFSIFVLIRWQWKTFAPRCQRVSVCSAGQVPGAAG